MNSFQKYPRLNILFFQRIIIIISISLLMIYFSSKTNEALDIIENTVIINYTENKSNANILHELELKKILNENRTKIHKNSTFIIITMAFGIYFFNLNVRKTEIENKRLDKKELD